MAITSAVMRDAGSTEIIIIAAAIEITAQITVETGRMNAVATIAVRRAARGFSSGLRKPRADLTELSRSRKIPVRETAKKMTKIIRRADTARVQKKR